MDRTRWQALFSVSGVVPLGAFLLLHLWTASALLSSHAAYDRQVGSLHGGPVLGLLTVVLILAPLAFHAGYGVWRWVHRPPTGADAAPPHAYESDLMLLLERISGVVVLAFVGAHFWETELQTWTGELAVGSYSTKLVEHLSSTRSGIPWVALGYLVGIAATVLHLVNGLTSFSTRWGLTPDRRSQRRARVLFRGAGALLFAVGAASVIELATGAHFFASAPAPLAFSPAGASGLEPGLCGTAAPSTTTSSAPLPSSSH